MRFGHVNIISNNWEQLADFYIKTCNCKIVPPVRNLEGKWLANGTGVKNAKLKGAHLLLPGYGENGPTLEIFQYANNEEQEEINPNKRGFGHIAFQVENVEETLQNVVKNGGKRFAKIAHKTIEGAGELVFTYARDPEGNIIELQSWK